MDRDTAIEIKDVSKSYKSVKALRDISFNIRKGELFGLIGPDGAGKTTPVQDPDHPDPSGLRFRDRDRAGRGA